MTNKFTTRIVNLASLDEYVFTIPTYQRPYVWGDEQIKKLLDDFHISFKADPKSIYYVSTFLTKDDGGTAELIDGQQRFTTLWLIALVISKLSPKSSISNFIKKQSSLRLGFEIRTEVSDFLKSLVAEDAIYSKVKSEEYITQQPYLKNIVKALGIIEGYLTQKNLNESELQAFGDYIYQNVHLVKNTTPPKTDLNKLFSTINSAGVQLEQTDIVKANLLRHLDHKVMYSRIWEACENMNNFFERNAKVSFPLSDWNHIDLNEQFSFDPEVFKYVQDGNDESMPNLESFTIDDIDLEELTAYQFPPKTYGTEKGEGAEDVYCRSIISFGQLLLHTYRIHLKKEQMDDFKGNFHVSRLIEIFKEFEDRKDQEEIERFFKLLWDVRYLFDKYIIKWISDSETKQESLELMNFNKSDTAYTRSKFEKSGSMMLQSVLYFTGDYLRQYWLTTYLGWLLDHHTFQKANADALLIYFEKIDNIFSVTNTFSDKDLSWQLLDEAFEPNANFDFDGYFNQSKGTGFKHYWFQKLEYILWKHWENRNDDKFKSYRITSKNSVEHIYPQNPENKVQCPEIPESDLHSFGNLVLLSVAQNSEYSNKSVRVKQSMFQEKSETYDTLKSYFIFQNQDWTPSEIDEHKKQMIKKIQDHHA